MATTPDDDCYYKNFRRFGGDHSAGRIHFRRWLLRNIMAAFVNGALTVLTKVVPASPVGHNT